MRAVLGAALVIVAVALAVYNVTLYSQHNLNGTAV